MDNLTRYKLFYIDPINPGQLRIYFIFEAVFVLLNFFIFAIFTAIVIKVRCHVNLKLIGVFFLTQYFPSLAGRLFILAHQSGFFHANRDPSEDILVIVISWWRCYSLSQILTIHIWVAIERQFAMYYIIDYEKNSRLWVPVHIIFVKATVCAITSTLWIFRIVHWLPLAILGISGCVVGVILFFNSYRGAKTLLDVLLKDTNCQHSYTLSLRYQLQENVWCDKLLKHAAIALFFVNVSTFSLFLAANLDSVEERFGEETSQWLDCLFNICVAVDGPLMAVGAIYCNDYLFNVMKALLRGAEVKDVEEEKEPGHVYFLQLEQQWDMPKVVENTRKKEKKNNTSRQQ